MNHLRTQILFLFLLSSFSCLWSQPGKKFRQLFPETTGIDFNNTVQDDAKFNFFTFQYIYNGAGVGVGDINNDGLPDLYFVGNQVPNRLFLNKGRLNFEDITEKAGVSGPENSWCNAVTFADVNADGWLDIYVSRSGPQGFGPEQTSNLLYVNQGNLTFKEEASARGINDAAHTTCAAFFDYDLDGDLDLFNVSHPLEFNWDVDQRDFIIRKGTHPDTDKLFQNDGTGHFTEVTLEAGIRNWAFGQSVSVGYLNNDQYPDLYVTNDYSEQDHYWINNGDGTFREGIFASMMHISNFSMGSDIADMDNDGNYDLIVADMMAEDNLRKKTNMSGMNPEAFRDNVDRGRHYQYMQNTLQRNFGNGTFGDIAELSGVANTDWSWSTIFADLDNDGWQDLLITNGIRRDMRSNDHSKKLIGMQVQEVLAKYDSILPTIPVEPLQNYVYQNQQDLTFKNLAGDWGIDYKGFSNGAAVADLDRDGDLDIVLNNLDGPALIYENRLAHPNFLRIRFEGPKKNPLGIGTQINLQTTQGQQHQTLFTSRGYLSSADPVLHFGLKDSQKKVRLEVIWPDGKVQYLENQEVNQELVLKYTDAQIPPTPPPPPPTWLQNVTTESGLNFLHQDKFYDDFEREVLLPHQYSQPGPFLDVADVNGDGYEDVYVGGGTGQAGALFLQTRLGAFEQKAGPWEAHPYYEDTDILFFDADGDGDMDLYVASGSNQEMAVVMYQDRLYLNDGKGNFSYADQALPDLDHYQSTSVVIPLDLENDGDLDLFVGSRVFPGRYPHPVRSNILENKGGKFEDVTFKWLANQGELGMVTDAWAHDWTGDGKTDLIVVGEWMSPQTLQNTGDHFENLTAASGIGNEVGWWYSLTPFDIDRDGDLDLLAGNFGLNTKYKATPQAPFMVYSDDLDANGSNDIVLSYAQDGQQFPVRGRQCSSEQIPALKARFPTYEAFGQATVLDIYGDALNFGLKYEATNMESMWFENLGGLEFRARRLPVEAQFSVMRAGLFTDLNGDGVEEWIMAGNLLEAEVETCRHDASIGVVLSPTLDGTVRSVPVTESGFFAHGNVRDLALVPRSDGKKYLVLTRSDGRVEVWLVRRK